MCTLQNAKGIGSAEHFFRGKSIVNKKLWIIGAQRTWTVWTSDVNASKQAFWQFYLYLFLALCKPVNWLRSNADLSRLNALFSRYFVCMMCVCTGIFYVFSLILFQIYSNVMPYKFNSEPYIWTKCDPKVPTWTSKMDRHYLEFCLFCRR